MRSYILSSILLTIHLCFTDGFPFPNADSRANPQNSFPSSSGNDVSNHKSPNDIGLQMLSVVGSGAPDRQQFINSLGLRNGLDLLMANFPGGHITGASKNDFREIPVFTGGNGFQNLPRNDQQLLAQGISNFLGRNVDHFNRREINVKDIANQNGNDFENDFRQGDNNFGSRNSQSVRNQNLNTVSPGIIRKPNFQNVQAKNRIQNPNTGSFTGIRGNDLQGKDAEFSFDDPRMLNGGKDFVSPFDITNFPEAPWDEFDNGPVNEFSRTHNGIFNFDGSSNRFGKSLRGQDGSPVRGLRGPEFPFDGPFGGIDNIARGQGSSQTSQGGAPAGFRGNEIAFGGPFRRHTANNNEQKGAQIQFNGAPRAAFAPVHGVPFGAFGFQNFPHGQSITPQHSHQAGAGSAPVFLGNKNGGSFGNGQGGPQHIDFQNFASGPVGSGIRRNGINELQNTFGGHGTGSSANNGLVINRQNMIQNTDSRAPDNRNFGQPFGFQGEHNSIHMITNGPGDHNFGLNKL